MKSKSSYERWINGEEEEQSLDVENQISSDIQPTITAGSSAHDSPAQAKLRAELKNLGLKICYQSRSLAFHQPFIEVKMFTVLHAIKMF